MRAMMAEGSLPRVLLPLLCISLFLMSNSFLEARSILVSFQGDFSKGPRDDQIRKLAAALLKSRGVSFRQCRVMLEGSSTVCNLHFDLEGLRVAIPSGRIGLQRLSARVPVGNILVLMNRSLPWPESVLAKDLRVEISSQELCRFLSSATTVKDCRVLDYGDRAKLELKAFYGRKDKRRAVKHYLEQGCALDLLNRRVYLRNAAPKGLVFLRGRLPRVLGRIEVQCLLHPKTLPDGGLAFSCSSIVVDGMIKKECPELFLASEEFSRLLQRLRSELDSAFSTRSFLQWAGLERGSGFAIEGMALLGMFDYIDGLKREKNEARSSREASLKLNIFR